jgi:hypothetical protein
VEIWWIFLPVLLGGWLFLAKKKGTFGFGRAPAASPKGIFFMQKPEQSFSRFFVSVFILWVGAVVLSGIWKSLACHEVSFFLALR